MLKKNENTDIDLLIMRMLDGEASKEDIIQIAYFMENSDEVKESIRQHYYLKYLLELDKNSKILDKNKAFTKFEEFMGEGNSKKVKIRPLKMISRIAAVIIVVLGIGFLISKYTSSSKLSTIHSNNTIDLKVDLPDGSIAYLNKGSYVTFPEKFKKNNSRIVDFEGEAFFEVVSIENSPFIVKVDEIQVEVLGTSFNIDAYPDNDKVIVSVQSGSVKISRVMPEGEIVRFIMLEDGEKVTYAKEQDTLIKNTIKTENYLAWKTGIIIFANTKFEKIAQVLEKEYNVQIVFKDEELKDCEFTGKFNNHTIEQIFEVLELALEIDFIQEGEIFTVSGTGC